MCIPRGVLSSDVLTLDVIVHWGVLTLDVHTWVVLSWDMLSRAGLS
jgi:hypothetical protein